MLSKTISLVAIGLSGLAVSVGIVNGPKYDGMLMIALSIVCAGGLIALAIADRRPRGPSQPEE